MDDSCLAGATPQVSDPELVKRSGRSRPMPESKYPTTRPSYEAGGWAI